MKIVFLVAVALSTSLFLESTAEPDLGSFLGKITATEKEKLNEMNSMIEKKMAECSTDVEKEKLAEIVAFLQKYYVPLADNMNKKLWKDVEDPKNRENIVIEFLEALIDVVLQVLKLKADLTESLRDVGENLISIFVDTIARDGAEYTKMMIKSLNGQTVETNNSGDVDISVSLESSPTPYLRFFNGEKIGLENAKIPEFKDMIEKKKAKCSTDADKEYLAKLIKFVEDFLELSGNINGNLWKDLDHPENRKATIIELFGAVLDVLLKVVLELRAASTETLREVKDGFEEIFLNIVVRYATHYGKRLIKSLPTENSCASQQTLYERMAESEKAVAETIEHVQNAMDKAAEDEKST